MDTSSAFRPALSPRSDEVRRQSFTANKPLQESCANTLDPRSLTLTRKGANGPHVASAGTQARLGSWGPDSSSLPDALSPVILRFLTDLEALGFALTSRGIRDLVFSNAIFGSIRTLGPHLVNVGLVSTGQHGRMTRQSVEGAECSIMFYRSLQMTAWAPSVRSLLAHGFMAGQDADIDHHAMLIKCNAWETQADGNAANLPADEVMALFGQVSDNPATAELMLEFLDAAKHEPTAAADERVIYMLAELQKLVLQSALDAISASLIAQRAQHIQQAKEAQVTQAVKEPVPEASPALPGAYTGFARLPGVLIAPAVLQFLMHLDATSLAGTCTRVRSLVLSDASYGPLNLHVGNVHTLARSNQAMARDRVDAARKDVAAFRQCPALWMPRIEAVLAPGIRGKQQICPEHQAMLLKCDAWIKQADGDAVHIPAHEVMAVMQSVGAGKGPQELVHDALDTAALYDPTGLGEKRLKFLLPMLRELVLERALDTMSARLTGQPAQPHPQLALSSPPIVAQRHFGSGHDTVVKQCDAWLRQAYEDPSQVPVDQVMAVLRCLGAPASEQSAISAALQSAVRQIPTGMSRPLMKSAITRVRDLVIQSQMEITLVGLNVQRTLQAPEPVSQPSN